MAAIAGLRGSEAAAPLAAQMRRTFGGAAADVAITSNSARPLAAQAEGVAVGEQVYIAPGFYDLTTVEGRERLGHEVAHVLQQRRGRDLPARLGAGERAGLEAEADRAGQAFARGQPFAVQGRAPAQVALFKGAAPATTPAATTTTIDLKSGGRIEPKPPAADPTAADPTAAPAAGGKPAPKAKEQLIVTYGGVQASNPFTIERDASGNPVKLAGRGKITLPASKYVKELDLDISLGPDGYLGAKLMHSSSTMIQLGGLTVQGGTLTAAIDHGQLTYALDGANLSLPKNIGEGALSIQGNGDQEPAFDASLAINVPRMQPATMSFHADASGYRAEGSTGVDIKAASGSVTFSLEKVGDDKALWSAAGTVGYNSERLSGQISVQYNADGELSGEGNLSFQIADFLTGQATVAVDKQGHVTVNGEISPPNETQLFPEKKIENTFFHKSVDFPIWGISIPMVGSVGIIAFIEGSMGYRVGVGAGVMRDIVLSGQYSTDPSVQPTFGITGEIFIPAFAELLISIGGGIKLDAFIADVGGGLKVDGRAGFYGGLSVRPSLAYDGGKYKLTGQAILGGDVGLQATLDAFVKLHVGKWMFSWEKEWDWKLGEWDKWLGLNLGMEADLDYTLGQPLSPDIFKLKKPDSLDVQGIAKSAMPKDGMPAEGAKGAQNEHEEFHQTGGGKGAPASGAGAQPQVAGTPAGAAGHKNQDPKGKTVKPGAPPKKAPPRKAKGKGPGQTGPNPKNHSKPTEPKLETTPIIESFNMHGESHQLIVQLGPGGHVDMASKRERLSVKVGQAVSKLTAKHASPQQIADLKEIGALAKKGDKMVATAKTQDKEGTTKAAHQIAAYGAKWEVKDLDEVAIKAPHALVATHPVHLEKLPDALNKVLGSAHNGQVIANKPGDPKEVTRQVLEKHADAHFDYASARLTLPALNAAPLHAAHSADQLGQLLAQQTGVTKVSLKQSAQKGELKVELIGAIGEASTTLGTAAVDAVPHTLAVPHPFHLDKPSEQLARALSSVHSGQVMFQKSGDPRQITHQLLQQHGDAHFDFPSAKLTLPGPQAGPLQAAHSVEHLGQLLAQHTGVSRITIKQTEQKGERKFELIGAIGEASATLGTAVVDPVPRSLAVPRPIHLEKPSPELAKALGAAHSGQTIFHGPGDPRQLTRQLLQRHADAHFDFPTGKLTLPAPQAAALQAAHGVDQLGQLLAQQTGVSKVTLQRTAQNGELKFELIGAIGEATATLGTVAVPHVHEWWHVKAPFDAASGKRHTLFFEGKGITAKLYMASTPRSLEQVLQDKDLVIEDRPSLENDFLAIKNTIASHPDIGEKSDAEQNDFQATIEHLVKALAEKLKEHLLHEGKLPASVVTFGSNQGRASFALGMPLTKNPGNTTGTPANDRLGTEGDRFVEGFVTKTSHYRTNPTGDRIKVEMHPLRQLHLLHKDLHGPFSPENIALGDPSMNGSMVVTEKTAISAIENEGQIRYRVDVTYHSEVRPPADPTVIPDDPVITVRNWVGFYIARKITVVATKWGGSAYSISLGEPLSVDGEIPAVTGEVVEKAEDVCFRIAQAHLEPTRPDKHLDGKVYKATSLKLGDLREKAGLNQNQMQLVSKKLQGDGRFHVIGGGSGPTIFVCE